MLRRLSTFRRKAEITIQEQQQSEEETDSLQESDLDKGLKDQENEGNTEGDS